MLEYSDRELVRFVYDKEHQKLIIEFKEKILDDGMEISSINEHLVFRRDEIPPILDRVFPNLAYVDEVLEVEARTLLDESRAAKKAKKEKANE